MQENEFARKLLTRRTFVAGAAIAAASVATTSLGGCANLTFGKKSENALSFTPGTYTASAKGRRNVVEIEVTFDETSIVSVNIKSADETPRISDMALETIPQKIIEYQSLGIDTISGATLTSMAILQAATDCVDQAGGDVKTLKSRSGALLSTEVVNLDADVVICGAGASGMAAAVAAAQSGAKKVIVLEKSSNIGGNCLVSGGYLEYIYPPDELKSENNAGFDALFVETLKIGIGMGVPQDYIDSTQQDFDVYKATGNTKVYDSEALYAIDYLSRAGGTLETWQAYAPMIVNLNEWLTDMGFEWTPCCAIVGFPWPRQSTCTTGNCGEGFFNTLDDAITTDNLPIEVILLTPASELITESDKVVGVKGICDDGTTYNVRASKGVVLAMGGYSGNPDMLKEYNKSWPWDENTVIPTTNAYGHTGDAITLTKNLNTMYALMDNLMVFPYADLKDYSTETIVGDTGNCLMVNSKGRRFVNETLSRHDISVALMEQEEPISFIISDSKNCLIENSTTQFGADAEKLIENMQLFKADDLEDLAKQMNVDANALIESISEFNTMVDMKSDPEFSRTVFTETSYVKTPPFYASPRTWAAHITVGGVATDNEFHVLNEDGQVIENLYCVGESACGFAGIGSMCTGMAASRMLFE